MDQSWELISIENKTKTKLEQIREKLSPLVNGDKEMKINSRDISICAQEIIPILCEEEPSDFTDDLQQLLDKIITSPNSTLDDDGLHKIFDLLYDQFIIGQRSRAGASKVIQKIIQAFPYELSSIDRDKIHKLIDCWIPRLIGILNKENIVESLIIIDCLQERYPRIMNQKHKNLYFVGEFFCTGIVLGKGQYATVFMGRNQRTAEMVAIKVLDRSALIARSANNERILQREIAIMKELDHFNVVHLYNVIEDGHFLYIVMEFCSGGTLDDFLEKNKRLSEEEAILLVKDLVEGLNYMRKKGIVHRDIKPANILRHFQGDKLHLKIADFTFARNLCNDHENQLQYTICGSPLYMSPEAFSDPDPEKSDIWSLGVVLYQLLFGRVPFTAEDAQSLWRKLLNDPLQFPADITVSEDMKLLLHCLLEKEPSKRLTWQEFYAHPIFEKKLGVTKSKLDASNDVALSKDEVKLLKALLKDVQDTNVELRARIVELEEENKKLKSQLK